MGAHDIGALVRAARKKAGTSQKGTARAAGITPASLCDFEHGRSIPTIVTALRLARAMGMTLDEIFLPDGEPHPLRPEDV